MKSELPELHSTSGDTAYSPEPATPDINITGNFSPTPPEFWENLPSPESSIFRQEMKKIVDELWEKRWDYAGLVLVAVLRRKLTEKAIELTGDRKLAAKGLGIRNDQILVHLKPTLRFVHRRGRCEKTLKK
jgi:hypothetical protein